MVHKTVSTAILSQAEVIEPLPGIEPDLRDVDDQPVPGTLLAALETSRVDYLITGDKYLLAMAERYPIVTPLCFGQHMREFDRKLQARGNNSCRSPKEIPHNAHLD